jgi:hypothetical protein
MAGHEHGQQRRQSLSIRRRHRIQRQVDGSLRWLRLQVIGLAFETGVGADSA